MSLDLKNLPGQFVKHLSYGKRVAPRRDWFILLSVVLLLLAASGLYNFWVYTQVKSGSSINGVVASAPGSGFDASALAKVKDIFTLRAAEQAKYTSGAYSFIDPSK